MSTRLLLATKNYLCKSVRSVGELNNFPTDYTDFHRLLTPSEFFAVRPDEYKTVACSEELSVYICEICGRTKKEAGRMSKHPFRAMI